MSLDDFIVNIFCETENSMEKFFEPKMLRTRGPRPQLADSEVLTIEIGGEILGLETDKAVFEFFKRFYRYYFPKLSCRVTFARQSAKLWAIRQRLFEHIAERFRDAIIVLDSLTSLSCSRQSVCRLYLAHPLHMSIGCYRIRYYRRFAISEERICAAFLSV